MWNGESEPRWRRGAAQTAGSSSALGGANLAWTRRPCQMDSPRPVVLCREWVEQGPNSRRLRNGGEGLKRGRASQGLGGAISHAWPGLANLPEPKERKPSRSCARPAVRSRAAVGCLFSDAFEANRVTGWMGLVGRRTRRSGPARPQGTSFVGIVRPRVGTGFRRSNAREALRRRGRQSGCPQRLGSRADGPCFTRSSGPPGRRIGSLSTWKPPSRGPRKSESGSSG